jgi:type IV pilus assembly protein PilF
MRSALTSSSILSNTSVWVGLLALIMLTGLQGCAVPAKSQSVHVGRTTLSPRMALAFAYYENGQYRVALDESRKALELQPDEPQALALQALIFARLNETALAQRSFLRAEQSAPQDADIAHNHGLFLCDQGQYPAAFERFARAVQQPLYAEKAKSLWVWGVCAQKAGDEAGAQALWTQSLAFNPSAPAALALAQSYQQHNQPSLASEVLMGINTGPAASPETLWVGLQWARKHGDNVLFKRYAVQLHKQFPTSSQWDAFQREAFDD